MKITIYKNGNDGGLSIEDGESAADVTRVIMQSAVSFVAGTSWGGKVDGGPSVEESFCRCKGI